MPATDQRSEDILMKMTWLFRVLAVGMISTPLAADDAVSHTEIRRLVEEQRIVALETILARYPAGEYGKLLDLEVEKEHGRIIYELEFLDPQGRVREYEVDAETGDLIRWEYD